MPPNHIIFSSPAKTFAKRLFGHMRFSWPFFFFIIINIVTLNREQTGAIIFLLVFFIIVFSYLLVTALKRAKWQITEIEVTPTDFLISVLMYDNLDGYCIPKITLNADYRWVPSGRSRFTKLTIYDRDTKLFTVYSDMSSESEAELEEIAFQINEEQNGICN